MSRPPEIGWSRTVVEYAPEGLEWMRAYVAGGSKPIAAGMDEALVLSQRGELAAARRMLVNAEEDVEAFCAAGPPEYSESMRQVLGRFLFGIRAYYHYRIGNLDAAAEDLDRAHDAVSGAVGHFRFLLPLAHHCHEFRLHQARIARKLNDWKTVDRCVEEVRAMLENRRPLCTLVKGNEIYVRDLSAFYEIVCARQPEWRPSFEPFFDEEHRLQELERFLDGLYFLPDMVVPPS